MLKMSIKRQFALLLMLSFSIVELKGQTKTIDIEKINHSNFLNPLFVKRKVDFMQNKQSNSILKYNPLNLALGSLMFLYQKVLTVQISSNCIYRTSCSKFSKELVRDFGLLKGVSLTADRLTRCTKIAVLDVSPLDIDPSMNKVIETTDKYKR